MYYCRVYVIFVKDTPCYMNILKPMIDDADRYISNSLYPGDVPNILQGCYERVIRVFF